jgi:hypothetical protein
LEALDSDETNTSHSLKNNSFHHCSLKVTFGRSELPTKTKNKTKCHMAQAATEANNRIILSHPIL